MSLISPFATRMIALLTEREQADTPEAKREAEEAMARLLRQHAIDINMPVDYKQAQAGRDE